jgi:predicted PurR-regulated permease PerM
VLLAVLVDTQLFLNRRFRRRLNPALAAATLLVVLGVTVAPFMAASLNDGLSQGVRELNRVRSDRADQSRQEDAAGQQALYQLLKDKCPGQAASCAVTVEAMRPSDPVASDPGATSSESASASGPADRLNSAADTGLALMVGLATGAVLVLLLVPEGLRRRMSEYGYQT